MPHFIKRKDNQKQNKQTFGAKISAKELKNLTNAINFKVPENELKFLKLLEAKTPEKREIKYEGVEPEIKFYHMNKTTTKKPLDRNPLSSTHENAPVETSATIPRIGTGYSTVQESSPIKYPASPTDRIEDLVEAIIFNIKSATKNLEKTKAEIDNLFNKISKGLSD